MEISFEISVCQTDVGCYITKVLNTRVELVTSCLQDRRSTS